MRTTYSYAKGLQLQELSGVGHMLSSILSTQLSIAEQTRLRRVLYVTIEGTIDEDSLIQILTISRLSMAEFLESLEDYVELAAKVGLQLRNHVIRIEEAISLAMSEEQESREQQRQKTNRCPESGCPAQNLPGVIMADHQSSEFWSADQYDASFPQFTFQDLDLTHLS